MQNSSVQDVETGNSKQRAGRPRSEDSHRSILDATRRLLTHNSVAKLSVESIAKKAGVGKTTIYRWWPNKQAVVMDAVFSQPGFHNILPASASSFEGVQAQVSKLMRQLSGKNGRIVAEIIGDAQGEPKALQNLIENFFQDRYNALAGYLEQGKEAGEFPADLDIEAAIDVILGPIIFRLMTGQDFDTAFEQNVTRMLQKALSA